MAKVSRKIREPKDKRLEAYVVSNDIDSESQEEFVPPVIRDQVCVPTDLFRKLPGMLSWCQTNCLRYPPNCPEALCTCPQVCEAVGEYTGREGADVYCMDLCIVYPPKCPRDKCRCY